MVNIVVTLYLFTTYSVYEVFKKEVFRVSPRCESPSLHILSYHDLAFI